MSGAANKSESESVGFMFKYISAFHPASEFMNSIL